MLSSITPRSEQIAVMAHGFQTFNAKDSLFWAKSRVGSSVSAVVPLPGFFGLVV